jgi:hypothetical protein
MKDMLPIWRVLAATSLTCYNTPVDLYGWNERGDNR